MAKREPIKAEDVAVPNEGEEFVDSRGFRYVRENGKRMLYRPGREPYQLPEVN